MDIDILLALQGLRDSLGSGWETFFNLVTNIPTSVLTYAIPVLLYLWFDKAAGRLVIMSFGLGTGVNSLVKNIACVYRPWIRDPRVIPSSEALPAATGYSFPSGHTQTMGSIWVGWGWAHRRRRWLLWTTVALTLLVGFSRCYLGVHTPQDVLVGLGISLAMLWAAGRLLAWQDAEPGRDLVMLVAGLAAVVACVAFLLLKSYPLDYVDGSLVVDPSEMVLDAYLSLGMLAGALVGLFLEGRFVGFSTDCPTKEKVVRLACSLVLAGLAYLLCQPLKAVGVLVAYNLLKGLAAVTCAVWAGPALAQAMWKRLRPFST